MSTTIRRSFMARAWAAAPISVTYGLLVCFPPRAHAQCELQKIILSDDQTGAPFGRTVSIDCDVAVIGWPLSIYRRIAGSWMKTQALFPAQSRSAGPGNGISVSGDVILAGISVFRRQGGVWVEEAILTVPGGGPTGFAAAVDGDVALVSIPPWIFRHNGTEWLPEQELIQPDPQPGVDDAFGRGPLALSGEVAVVTALTRTESEFYEGALYVYRYTAGTWIMEQKLLASDAVGADFLGWSVAIDGKVIVAGATKELHCQIPEEWELCEPGAAYVFRFDGNAWIEEQKLVPSDGNGGDDFGAAVDIRGDTIIVGSPDHETGGVNGAGAAYVFRWAGVNWTHAATLAASDSTSGAEFESAVAHFDATAIIGAPYADGNETRAGAAYVFAVAGDCNANGEIDACEILADPSLDINGNLVIDYCSDIPAVSHWGLAAAALLLLAAGSIVLRRRGRSRGWSTGDAEPRQTWSGRTARAEVSTARECECSRL